MAMALQWMLTLGFLVLAEAAKKVEESVKVDTTNGFVAYATSLAMAIWTAVLATVIDAWALIVAGPGFAVSVFVWILKKLREFPDLVANVYKGDEMTLNSLTSFCADAACIIFTVYAALAALNLLLGLIIGVKDYFVSYMDLPTSILGKKLPSPLMKVRDLIQKQLLDRFKKISMDAWIIPLEGQSGKPSLKEAVPVLASAMSACILLACAPAVLSLIKGGADKAKAEALLYTMGLGLGVKYVVGRY